jgi:AAA domain (dynein-related subfamily)
MTVAEEKLDDLLRVVTDPTQPKSSYRPLEALFAELLGRPAVEVYAAQVSKPGNLSVRADQSPRSRAAKVFVAVVPSAIHSDGTAHALGNRIGPGRYEGGVVVAPTQGGPWQVTTVVSPAGSRLAPPLLQAFPTATPTEVAGSYAGNGGTVYTPPSPPPPISASAPLVLPPRVKRMLRIAIASSKAVMVVGPPGTGKTTLLEEALQEIRDDAPAYGLAAGPDGVRQVTPEESWTTRDLLGGETVDDQGRLRFRPGHVLEAIRDNEWLFLDEANRADMDKIFGGLLTWLSERPVIVGRVGTDLHAPKVVLEWGSDTRCVVHGYDRLAEDGGTDPIRFVAGTDWRLVGTYNALDAHRVFRFGQALGRRFAHVPMPPISVDDFEDALQPQLDLLPSPVNRVEVMRVLRGLYALHLGAQPPLGPAIFLAVPKYVASGLGLLEVGQIAEGAEEPPESTGVRLLEVADADENAGESPYSAAGAAPVSAGGAAGDSGPDGTLRLAVAELMAEAYVLGAGTWLAQLEPDELAGFRRRVVEEQRLFVEAQWTFIQELLPALA